MSDTTISDQTGAALELADLGLETSSPSSLAASASQRSVIAPGSTRANVASTAAKTVSSEEGNLDINQLQQRASAQAEVLFDQVRAFVANLGKGTVEEDGFHIMNEAAKLCQAGLMYKDARKEANRGDVFMHENSIDMGRSGGVAAASAAHAPASCEDRPENSLAPTSATERPTQGDASTSSARPSGPDDPNRSSIPGYQPRPTALKPAPPYAWEQPEVALDWETSLDPVAMGWPQFAGINTIDYVASRVGGDENSIEETLEDIVELCRNSTTPDDSYNAKELGKKLDALFHRLKFDTLEKFELLKMRDQVWRRELEKAEREAERIFAETGERHHTIRGFKITVVG